MKNLINSIIKQNNIDILTRSIFALIIISFCLMSTVDCFAAGSLEESMEKSYGLVKKIKEYGIPGAATLIFIFAIFRGSLKLAGITILIGVMYAAFMGWIEGGLQF